MNSRRLLAITILMLLAVAGCQNDQAVTIPTPSNDAQTTDTVTEEEVASLVWVQSDIQEGDFVLSLGHRGDDFKGGDSIEPAVSIMIGDAEVKDAIVHNSLVATDGKTVLAKEQPCTFSPTTEDEPAHYAKGALKIPQDSEKFLIRFRIKLPEVETESIYDIEHEIGS